MQIDAKWLNNKEACKGCVNWFFNNYGENAKINSFDVLDKLISDQELTYANWFIVRIMTRPQYLAYASFASEQVLHIFEEKYPNNNNPRKAINAAKKVLENDTEKNRRAAAIAVFATTAAAAAAAAYAAYAAAAADDAAYAAASYAASCAADSYDDADKIKLKILNYGISLLKGNK